MRIMLFKTFAFFLLFIPFSKAQMPDTDIWLLELKNENGKTEIGSAQNITSRPGYDNQPEFSEDGDILFTSIRENGQSDIYLYEINNKMTRKVTSTEISEYSPTRTKNKNSISVVVVEKDSAQRLWSIPIGKGEAARLSMEDSIGYHAWLNEDTLAVFILTKPSSLRLISIKTKNSTTITDSIGRCIKKIPGENAISFTRKNSKDQNLLYFFNFPDKNPQKKFELAGEDYAWASEGKGIYTGIDSKLRFISRDGKLLWEKDLISYGIKNVSRIAVHPKGRIALVSSN